MKTIRSKLLLSMSAAMLISIGITLVLFIHLIDGLIVNQAKSQLHGQVPKALRTLDNGDLSDLDRTNFKFVVRGVMLDADYMVLDDQRRVIAASDSDEEGTVFMGRSHNGEGVVTLHGTRVLYSQARLKGLPYSILIYSPLSSIRALSGSILKVTLISIIASFAIILCIALLTISRIVKPLNRLKETVSRYEPHHPLQGPFPEEDRSEIGELSRNFHLMADRIAHHSRHQREFLQNVSHELKTPLMSINGYVFAIRDGVVTQDEGLKIITSQSRRLVDMVDKLLTLSRLESMEESWPLEELEIGEMVREALDLMRPAAAESSVSIELAGSGFQVRTAGEQLFRVLLNLLQNAVRHTNSIIRVTMEQEGEYWAFHVDDDGPGIAEDKRNEVFGRFVTGANGVTGLGLAISRQIAIRLGAELSYSESPLGGARFSFICRNN
ncbi:HAMP domain-containing histidine kinase [Paenibacillus sp. HN-1]|uniref:HAMP domain-containing sensor histidine kinase n=1 Tax=Paenibacillus TaxID=44249 RepID=UPI001CA8F881|nr:MULTISPECIES: HAMP domain-containing sensor histidine kinase [Paenibacillus]MBY9078402.1 HAMP domain-containing histidine kinase [Paenibacillus sp. CGMCC 1.18879]MBY9087883.1 HAMP domain-containing histidine kinase [Paenibacillus sinensis]